MRQTTIVFDELNVKGKVIMSVLPGRERLNTFKQINLNVDGGGNIHFNNETIEAVIKGASIAEKYIIEIDLEVNGNSITTFEDLEYSNGFNVVIMKLITVLLNGPEQLGN